MTQCKKLYWLEYLLIFSCISFLRDTDSYYPVYIVVGVFGCIALYANAIRRRNGKEENATIIDKMILITFAVIFTVAVVLSNYFLFEELSYYEEATTWFNRLYKYSLFMSVASGCFLIFYHILYFLSYTIFFAGFLKNADGRRPKLKDQSLRDSFLLIVLFSYLVLI